MKNLFLSPRTAADIDKRIEKVLRGLGDPEPPINLAVVRELLKLDQAYYSTADDSFLREVISHIKIGTIQALKRPTLILEAIRKFDLKALYIPDRKRIFLDQSVPEIKHRWIEAHEITHDLCPWHHDMLLGDTKVTLRLDCHEQLEAEANFGAGRLLFLRDRFTKLGNDTTPSLQAVRDLAPIFDNTLTSTLWRYVEATHVDLPMVAMVSGHPHLSKRKADFDPANPCRYYIRSAAFAARFDRLSETEVFDAVSRYCGAQRGGPLGSAEIQLRDDNGDMHLFAFETFFNGHEALTLGVYRRACPTPNSVPAR